MFGDGYCDRGLNNPECDYDGGDCCTSDLPAWDKHCEGYMKQDCMCLDPNPCKDIKKLSGNGHCDRHLNNERCDYDGGDCCKHGFNHTWSGDGICDPKLNTPQCGYDGGDCCNRYGGMRKYIGDQICDYYNNKPQCKYDGGDCCNSTCKKSICDCKDPKYQEP